MADRSPVERALMIVLNTIYLLASLPLLLVGLVLHKLWERT